jgi:hypothetical protein
MNSTLDLLSLDETGVAKLYADRIEPILQSGEAERKVALRTFWARIVPGAIAAAAFGAVVIWMTTDAMMGLIFGGIGIAGAYWFAYRPLQGVADATKERSLGAVADAIGCSFTRLGFEPVALAKFNELRLLPSCERSSYEDCFDGSHHGCQFSFYEGHLEVQVRTKNGSHWKTVFRGQLIRIAFPKKFHGTTVVRRDAGVFNFMQSWFSTLQRVGLGDSRLEKAFEVYSNDQVEARYLIHPVFMERLLELETRFKGKNLRCAFQDGDLLIAVEGGDKFEVGSMFARLDDIERARVIVSDITEIMRVIDAVLTAEQGALPT